MQTETQSSIWLPRNAYTKPGQTAHIVIGDSYEQIGHVDMGIVFVINPCLSTKMKGSGGLMPLDWIVAADPGYFLGAKAGRPDHGVQFMNMYNAYKLQLQAELVQDQIEKGETFNPELVESAQHRCIVPGDLRRQMPQDAAFRGLPKDAWDMQELGLLKGTSIGLALAASRWLGLKAAVISGIDRLRRARNPKPLMLFTQWVERVQPRWCYSFTSTDLGLRTYVHPSRTDGAKRGKPGKKR